MMVTGKKFIRKPWSWLKSKFPLIEDLEKPIGNPDPVGFLSGLTPPSREGNVEFSRQLSGALELLSIKKELVMCHYKWLDGLKVA